MQRERAFGFRYYLTSALPWSRIFHFPFFSAPRCCTARNGAAQPGGALSRCLVVPPVFPLPNHPLPACHSPKRSRRLIERRQSQIDGVIEFPLGPIRLQPKPCHSICPDPGCPDAPRWKVRDCNLAHIAVAPFIPCWPYLSQPASAIVTAFPYKAVKCFDDAG